VNDDGIECDMRVGNLTCDLVNRSCSVGSTDILSAPLREDLSSDISGFSSLEPEAVFKDMRAGRTGPCKRRNLPLVISLNISLCHHQKCWTNTPLLLDSMPAASEFRSSTVYDDGVDNSHQIQRIDREIRQPAR
jgi:hypothetical protein